LAEKDVAEKLLEDYNDVFSDIVNVLLFDGRQEVLPEELTEAQPISQYKADGKVHEQERDTAKFWNRSRVHIALMGLENQTVVDADMPLRVIGYDGAAYRSQLLKQEQKNRYPVVTLVLYFGKTPWQKPTSLYDCVQIPEDLKKYVSDYKINVFDIPRLPRETVEKFRSDFRIVADYFVQTTQNHDNYEPSKETIEHVDEILKLMSILTRDHRFEEMMGQWQEGENATMCEVLDRAIGRGIEIGEARGEARGKASGIQIGEARGEARGIHIGETRGREEAYLRSAAALLKNGISPEIIAQCTELPLERILALQANEA